MFSDLFSAPFRPFFIICSLLALINPTIWMFTYSGHIEIITYFSTPSAWHGFEMLFGFSQSIMTGFLLTASSNWTGKKPFQGFSLGILVMVFLLERIWPFIFVSKTLSFILINISQFIFLGFLVIMLRGNRNQRIITPIVLIFSLSKLAYSYGAYFDGDNFIEYGRYYGVISFLILIVIFTGRILPMFSARHLGFKPNVPKVVNNGAVCAICLLLIPPQILPKYLEALILLSGIIFSALRLYYWKLTKVMKFPLLGVLHMGQLFMIISLIIKLLTLFVEDYATAFVPLHSLTVGTLGIFGIGMMLRVSKGHTGREMKADIWDKYIFHGIYFCAILRILPAFVFEDHMISLFSVATLFWFISYFVFLVRYSGPLLLPRVNK